MCLTCLTRNWSFEEFDKESESETSLAGRFALFVLSHAPSCFNIICNSPRCGNLPVCIRYYVFYDEFLCGRHECSDCPTTNVFPPMNMQLALSFSSYLSISVVFLQEYWNDFLFGAHGCGVLMALVGNMLLFNVLAIHGILCSILPCFVSQNMAFYFMKGGILNVL